MAEVLPLGDAEFAHGGLELAGPDLAEAPVVVRRIQLGDDDLAELVPGARHEDDAVAVPDGLRHEPTGADRLVVGVSVNGHEGTGTRLGHRGIVPWSCPEVPARLGTFDRRTARSLRAML